MVINLWIDHAVSQETKKAEKLSAGRFAGELSERSTHQDSRGFA